MQDQELSMPGPKNHWLQRIQTDSTEHGVDLAELYQILGQAPAFAPQGSALRLQTTHFQQARPSAAAAIVHEDGYLPIEAFKYRPEACMPDGPVESLIRFCSSGTTSTDRSQSYFSPIGLKFYEEQAWQAFSSVLKVFFPHPEKVRGFRLVPTQSEWPESSLAHMLDSFSTKLDICYDPGCQATGKQLNPLWIFGTAFHYMNLFDQGFRCPLPKGSVIFETGGTKGRSRDVSRLELYQCISEMFHVATNFIVSEYGMSELACQAYDFVNQPEVVEQSIEKRFYRFPRWVQLKVQTSQDLQDEGCGALIVGDPLRIDCSWPIRTQDLVELKADGYFRLIGRVPSATLKGCSMRAEDLMIKDKSSSIKPASAGTFCAFDETTVRQRCYDLHAKINALLSSQHCHQLFTRYFQSQQLASWVQGDLIKSLPKTADLLFEAAFAAAQGKDLLHHWLIIGPQSHPIALLHPMCLGAALGINLTIRLNKSEENIVTWFANELKDSGAQINFLPHDFRLNGFHPSSDAIMIFGSDDTVRSIESLTGQQVQGFGSHITSTVIYASEIERYQAMILKDSFSLKQRGCRSSRLLFVVHDNKLGSKSSQIQIDRAANSLASLWKSMNFPMTEWDGIALNQEMSRLKLLGINYFPKSVGSILKGLFPVEVFTNQKNLNQYLSLCPYVLPLVTLDEQNHQRFFRWLSHESQIKSLSLSPLAKKLFHCFTDNDLEISSLGEANVLPWNGWHDMRPLFQIRSLARKLR